MIAGMVQLGCTCEGCACTASVNVVRAEHFQPLDFIRADALGSDTSPRCAGCQNCKEYKFRADSIRFMENKEYRVINTGL
jgi:hypothetical protein